MTNGTAEIYSYNLCIVEATSQGYDFRFILGETLLYDFSSSPSLLSYSLCSFRFSFLFSSLGSV